MENILTMESITTDDVMRIINRALEFKKGRKLNIGNKSIMNMFFENSTRTKTSFQMAESNLGMNILNFDADTSSIKKGETLYDTVKTVESIGVDIAVIRDSQDEYYQELKDLNIHILNAGDGKGQHPSQSFLDLMTIYEKFGKFEGLNVAIVGDLKHSRVAHSNSSVLKRLGANLYYGGPKSWYTEEFQKFGEYRDIDELVNTMDVIMLLRVQKERLNVNESSDFTPENYLEKYGLTMNRSKKMSPNAIIMHPAPVNRGIEIADEVVECNKSVIFPQMTNGVFARMAMIEEVLLEEAQ
ncbi:aspartate carbamoyltransferase [Companilactobacillus sp. RD055328]|uniref:aspartate carbamoyltransferase catalytic subunit n=1 Tax=Companilactobacillus sp. RD055328 TaxID=2916634 RepID=UPI001FC7C078|nr:aspartate carbamoyltransferase catalytic subunit [Companilactobacillus sp. RD055328]GKQ42790.1 aspartate carbamoyltransferase [Companilactobacillus sp. RD055328]